VILSCILSQETLTVYLIAVPYPGCFSGEGGVSPGFFFGGVQQIQLRTEGRENGDLGAVPPSQGLHSICRWVKPVFLLGCYGFIFHGSRNLAQLRNFGGGVGVEPPPPRSARHWLSLRKWNEVWTYLFARGRKPQLTNTLEVKYAIRGLKVTKADPKGIPRRVLKHLPTRAVTFLKKTLNSVLGRQRLLLAWKRGHTWVPYWRTPRCLRLSDP
jgi:hypothetical protein